MNKDQQNEWKIKAFDNFTKVYHNENSFNPYLQVPIPMSLLDQIRRESYNKGEANAHTKHHKLTVELVKEGKKELLDEIEKVLRIEYDWVDCPRSEWEKLKTKVIGEK